MKSQAKKVNFAILLLLFSFNGVAAVYHFKFDYGIGMNTDKKSICFYQLVESSGKISEKIPVNITNGIIIPIKFKKSKVREIIFSGYYLDAEVKKRRSFLGVSKLVNSLTRGEKKPNSVLIIAATEEDNNYTPVAELVRILSNKEYNKLLNRSNNEVFGYNNTFPIGQFILYNPEQNISKDVIKMHSKNAPFIQNSRAVYDHYILQKQLGVDFEAGYKRLNVATHTDKQQFIEYTVKIDTLQMINWISEESEMKFLYDKVNKNELDFLRKDIEEIQDWRLYFVSSCLEIKNFKIESQVFDSLATATNVNIDVPADASDLTIKAGVVYGKSEGSMHTDETFIYYTGFKVRDYTKNIRDYFASKSLEERIVDAENELNNKESEVKELFVDFRKVDSSILDFTSTDMIIRFFEKVEPKEFKLITDTLVSEIKLELEAENIQILNCNFALEVLKEKIVEYKNAKNYLDELNNEKISGKTNIQHAMQPKEIKIDDRIVEGAIDK